MKWILLVYIITTTPVIEEHRQRRLEFPIEVYADCALMARHITHIESYIRITSFPFVKSLYHAHKYAGNDTIFAFCVYSDPNNIPEWADEFLKK